MFWVTPVPLQLCWPFQSTDVSRSLRSSSRFSSRCLAWTGPSRGSTWRRLRGAWVSLRANGRRVVWSLGLITMVCFDMCFKTFPLCLFICFCLPWKEGRRAVPMDIDLDPSTMNLLEDRGFCNALFAIANLEPGSGSLTAPVCASFVFLKLTWH